MKALKVQDLAGFLNRHIYCSYLTRKLRDVNVPFPALGLASSNTASS